MVVSTEDGSRIVASCGALTEEGMSASLFTLGFETAAEVVDEAVSEDSEEVVAGSDEEKAALGVEFVDLDIDRVTRREEEVGASEKFSELGRSGRDTDLRVDLSSSTTMLSVEVRPGERVEIDSERLFPKVASVVVTTLLVSCKRIRHPFCAEIECP